MSWFVSQAETPPTTPTPMSPKKKGLIIAGIVLALILVIVLVVVLCVIFLESDPAPDKELDDYDQIESLMDIEVDPCEDFYSYACGGWVRAQNSTQRIAFGTSMIKEMDKRILELLKIPIEVGDPMYTQLPKKFFALCNNTQRINELGKKPFLDFLKTVGKFPLLDPSWKEEDFDFFDVLAKLAPLGVSTFFITAALANAWRSTIAVYPPENYLIRQSQYIPWTKEMFSFLGVNVVEQKDDIEELFKVDEKIYSITSGSMRFYNSLTVSELADVVPWFPWSKLFSGISDGVLNMTQDVGNIKIHNLYLNQVAAMETIVNSTSKRTLANYLLKSTLRYMSALDTTLPSLPYEKDSILQAKHNFDTREERCVFETRALLPEPIHRMYHDKSFNKGSVPFINEMLNDLKAAYSTSINEALWLNQSERFKYNEQVEGKDLLMGNPAYLFDDGLLNNLYLDIPYEEDYFTNVTALVRHRFKNTIKDAFSELGPVRFWKQHWNFPFSSNGFHLFEESKDKDFIILASSIFLPPDLVQMPAFHPKWRSSMKYGALGTVLGHHLMHAIAEDLFLSNKDYPNRRGCLNGHYSSMSYRNVEVHGTNVTRLYRPMQENECDIQGIKVSFKAYRKFVERNGEERNLQKLNLSPNQIFFISYAQMMCEWIPIGGEKDAFNEGKYPFYIRVNGALRETKDFAEAFRCKTDSKMNLKNKCSVL